MTATRRHPVATVCAAAARAVITAIVTRDASLTQTGAYVTQRTPLGINRCSKVLLVPGVRGAGRHTLVASLLGQHKRAANACVLRRNGRIEFPSSPSEEDTINKLIFLQHFDSEHVSLSRKVDLLRTILDSNADMCGAIPNSLSRAKIIAIPLDVAREETHALVSACRLLLSDNDNRLMVLPTIGAPTHADFALVTRTNALPIALDCLVPGAIADDDAANLVASIFRWVQQCRESASVSVDGNSVDKHLTTGTFNELYDFAFTVAAEAATRGLVTPGDTLTSKAVRIALNIPDSSFLQDDSTLQSLPPLPSCDDLAQDTDRINRTDVDTKQRYQNDSVTKAIAARYSTDEMVAAIASGRVAHDHAVIGLASTSSVDGNKTGGARAFLVEASVPHNNIEDGIPTRVVVTGNAGPLLRESALVAFSAVELYLRKSGELLSQQTSCNVAHVHLAGAAARKDGTSAGAAIVAVLLAAMVGGEVRRRTAVIGEVTISGLILPVAHTTTKVAAAIALGVTCVVVPSSTPTHALRGVPRSLRVVRVEDIASLRTAVVVSRATTPDIDVTHTV